MFSLVIGTVTFVTSMAVQASPIFGFVEITENRYLLHQEAETFEIQSTSLEVTNTLQRLRTGDYLAFEGYISPAQRKAIIQSIDWVGLQRLIGYWRTSDKKLVEFSSFTNMKFHQGNPNEIFIDHRPRYEGNSLNVNYRVAPSVGTSWSFFLSNQGNVKVGKLVLFDRAMAISFFDNQTGRITKTVTLQKVPQLRNANR
jgi:hypothetical protein